MIKLLLFYLFCQISTAEIHSVKFYATAASGIPKFPAFQIVATFDDDAVVHCESNNETMKVYYDWVKEFLHDEPEVLRIFNAECLVGEQRYGGRISVFRTMLKQSEGVHTLQAFCFCERDEETEKINAGLNYGYDGEDFIALDLEALKWIALKPQAIPIEIAWNTDKERMYFNRNVYTKMCPGGIKTLLDKEKDILLRTEYPSVSLLQKTSSSPVSCHATGFYPNRAQMFWRKDGEEIHENVDPGEILSNNDGTFQMTVSLNISSISLKDWRRYDCVFQLLGKEKEIVKLDEEVIRTNREKPMNSRIPIIASVIAFVLVSIAAAAGYVAYKKKAAPERDFYLTESLNS